MMKIASEYERYQVSSIMKKLASSAHQDNYLGQTSSATYDEIAELCSMSFTTNSCVLDAGCGDGSFSLEIAKNFPCYVQGVDLSEKLVEEASNKAAIANLTEKCRFFSGDFTKLPSDLNGSFDLILCIGSLYWGQSLSDTFATWHRVARPNAELLLFLNLLHKPLTFKEKKFIGATQFIPAPFLKNKLVKNGWRISHWSDETPKYLEWLQRWCLSMERMSNEIIMEMGQEAASQLFSRFNTYQTLAKRQAVKRIILRAKRD